MIDAKIIAGLVVLLLIGGTGIYGYVEGRSAGESAIQVKWDLDKQATAKVAAAALAQANAERDAAIKHNGEIDAHYQSELSASSAAADALAERLRSAALAASRRAVPEAANRPGTAQASANPSADQLTSAVAAVLQECADNSAQLNALIAEIKPQLEP